MRLDFAVAALSVAAAVLAAAPARADTPARWRSIDNPGPVFGLDGRPHVAACSGYPGTDPRFKFWTRPGKSKDLVVFFEGGGACWDSLTCTFPIVDGLPAEVPQFFVPSVPGGSPAGYDGIFNATNATNPVKDWTFVYIPYCTGDVHGGSADRTYANVGHPVFPLPSLFDIHHGGYDNFMVVLDWMRKHIDKPERVLVAGSSAGGYGASINFPWVHKAFPRAQLAVMADASQGVLTHTFDLSTPGRGSWNVQLAPFAFGNDPLAVASPDVLRVAAHALPRTRVAQFTTTFDEVQIGFYGLTKQYYPPGGACPNLALDWNQQMVRNLNSSAATVPNYRHYLAQGSFHTILRSPEFYTEDSAGPKFKHWLAAMLNNEEDDHRVPGWRNVACPGCLLSIPCH